jgi:hypothetical protein
MVQGPFDFIDESVSRIMGILGDVEVEGFIDAALRGFPQVDRLTFHFRAEASTRLRS